MCGSPFPEQARGGAPAALSGSSGANVVAGAAAVAEGPPGAAKPASAGKKPGKQRKGGLSMFLAGV